MAKEDEQMESDHGSAAESGSPGSEGESATSAPGDVLAMNAADELAASLAGETADDLDETPKDEPDMLREGFSLGAWGERLPLLLAVGFAALLFFALPPLSESGIWDPYELNVADLARRVAINLHGASQLVLADADNSLPHLNDLGRPQLAFTSMALGFKFFGLHDWAGRVPLALWGLVGVAATYGFLARLVDKRAGVFGAVALATMPIYFVQARTMLGDIVPMSALAMSLGGLLVVLLDKDPKVRGFWLLVALLGLAAGASSRGILLGVGVPTLATGLVWSISRRRSDSFATDAVGGVSLVVGLAVGYFAWRAMELTEPKADLNPWLGAMVRPPAKYPTFDYYIGHLGPALAPWSGFIPMAVGRMFLTPPKIEGEAAERESRVRAGLLVGAATALLAHGLLVARTDLLTFTGAVTMAGIVAIALRDYERGAHASVVIGVGTVVFLALFHHDLHAMPEKAYQAFGITSATFPESFKDRSLALWTVVLIGFAVVAFLTFVERDAQREPFDPKSYLKILDGLRNSWDGSLSLAYFAIVAGASLAALVVWGGTRLGARWLPNLSFQMRAVAMNAWWVVAIVPLAIIFGLFFACDVWLWAFRRSQRFGLRSFMRFLQPLEAILGGIRTANTNEKGEPLGFVDDVSRILFTVVVGVFTFLAIPGAVGFGLFRAGVALPYVIVAAVVSGPAFWSLLGAVGDLLRGSRAAFLVVAGAGMGIVLSGAFYPALANQLSPKEVFDSYAKHKKGDEPLALFGVGGKTAAYYAGGQPTILNDTNLAFAWLTSAPTGSRRFMATRADELARMNQMFRQREHKNVPVIDGRSSQIMLLASALDGSEKSQNPLSKIVMNEVPSIQRPVDVNLEDKLAVLGLDITDSDGKLVEAVSPIKKYHIRTYYRVMAPIGTEWEAFIHVDGFHRRHNGDHKTCGGKYPMMLWLPGDIIVDDYEFSLEPNFNPGDYAIYFGFWLGESRMKVKSGPSDGDNRINGGSLRVR